MVLLFTSVSFAETLKGVHEQHFKRWLELRNHRVDKVEILEKNDTFKSLVTNMAEKINGQDVVMNNYVIKVITPTSSFICDKAILITDSNNPQISRGDSVVSGCTL